jgi:hypothetical protein
MYDPLKLLQIYWSFQRKKNVSLWFLERIFWQYWNSRTWYQLWNFKSRILRNIANIQLIEMYTCVTYHFRMFYFIKNGVKSDFGLRPFYANSRNLQSSQIYKVIEMNCVTNHFTMFFLPKSCGNIRFWIETIFHEFAKFAKFANRQSYWNFAYSRKIVSIQNLMLPHDSWRINIVKWYVTVSHR